jgi:hypothetical protein
MESLWVSTCVVALAEVGDKTQIATAPGPSIGYNALDAPRVLPDQNQTWTKPSGLSPNCIKLREFGISEFPHKPAPYQACTSFARPTRKLSYITQTAR